MTGERWEDDVRAADAYIRASDSEREEVVERLREASTEARLTMAELVERSEIAFNATTRSELEKLTDDLPAPASEQAPASAESARPPRKGKRWIMAIMGGANRRGRWRPSDQLGVVAVMGGSNLDLRNAEVPGSEITITAVTFMGGVDIVVPEGVEVELSGFHLMGGHDENVADVPPRPSTPLVRVRAFSLMGGVNVKSKPSRNPTTGADGD